MRGGPRSPPPVHQSGNLYTASWAASNNDNGTELAAKLEKTTITRPLVVCTSKRNADFWEAEQLECQRPRDDAIRSLSRNMQLTIQFHVSAQSPFDRDQSS